MDPEKDQVEIMRNFKEATYTTILGETPWVDLENKCKFFHQKRTFTYLIPMKLEKNNKAIFFYLTDKRDYRIYVSNLSLYSRAAEEFEGIEVNQSFFVRLPTYTPGKKSKIGWLNLVIDNKCYRIVETIEPYEGEL